MGKQINRKEKRASFNGGNCYVPCLRTKEELLASYGKDKVNLTPNPRKKRKSSSHVADKPWFYHDEGPDKNKPHIKRTLKNGPAIKLMRAHQQHMQVKRRLSPYWGVQYISGFKIIDVIYFSNLVNLSNLLKGSRLSV